MFIYTKPNSNSYPSPEELGLRDYYHDKDGNYAGIPVMIPSEYKGNEKEWFRSLSGRDVNEEIECPKYDKKQEYQLESEAKAENLSWGRYHYTERIYGNKKYEAWLENWN